MRRRAGQPGRRGEIDIQSEQRQADRAERHQADFDVLAGHALAEHGANANTDGEDRQQQRHRRLTTAQHEFGIGRKLRQKQRAIEPEPRDAEDGQENRAVLSGEGNIAPSFRQRVEIDLQFRRWRRGARNTATGQIAG